jgi:PTS system mannitol-specific IIA component/PTS system ascorbate-specific IIA component
MIQEILKGNIQFKDEILDWKEAIRISAEPLLKKSTIHSSYIDAMINNVIENGNYIIILPEIAMPHARHEFGAIKTGISFLKVNQPVLFPGDEPVYLFFTLSAETNDGHLDLLADLGEALTDSDKVQALKESISEEDVLNIFSDSL